MKLVRWGLGRRARKLVLPKAVWGVYTGRNAYQKGDFSGRDLGRWARQKNDFSINSNQSKHFKGPLIFLWPKTHCKIKNSKYIESEMNTQPWSIIQIRCLFISCHFFWSKLLWWWVAKPLLPILDVVNLDRMYFIWTLSCELSY